MVNSYLDILRAVNKIFEIFHDLWKSSSHYPLDISCAVPNSKNMTGIDLQMKKNFTKIQNFIFASLSLKNHGKEKVRYELIVLKSF